MGLLLTLPPSVLAALLLTLLARPLPVATLLLGLALASAVGGLLAGVAAEAALAAWVVGLGELPAAVLAVPPDDSHRCLPRDDWSVTRDGRRYRLGEVSADD
jgi:hypothetical protein